MSYMKKRIQRLEKKEKKQKRNIGNIKVLIKSILNIIKRRKDMQKVK